jgi:hypothetical protein
MESKILQGTAPVGNEARSQNRIASEPLTKFNEDRKKHRFLGFVKGHGLSRAA